MFRLYELCELPVANLKAFERVKKKLYTQLIIEPMAEIKRYCNTASRA